MSAPLMIAFRLAVGLSVLGCATVALARPDLNAFLNERSMSVSDLVRQVKRDPEVMDRYRRHFAMGDKDLVAYLGSLRLARLSKKGVYRVYSVPPGGWIKMHYETLREGIPVFADMAGEPVLLVKCGNPLTNGPRNPIAENDDSPEIQARTDTLRELTVAADTPSSADLAAMAPSTPQVPAEEIVTIGQSPVPILPGAFGASPWLLGSLGFLFVGREDEGSTTTAIPEPSTIAVLALGTGLLARRRRKRAL